MNKILLLHEPRIPMKFFSTYSSLIIRANPLRGPIYRNTPMAIIAILVQVFLRHLRMVTIATKNTYVGSFHGLIRKTSIAIVAAAQTLASGAIMSRLMTKIPPIVQIIHRFCHGRIVIPMHVHVLHNGISRTIYRISVLSHTHSNLIHNINLLASQGQGYSYFLERSLRVYTRCKIRIRS